MGLVDPVLVGKFDGANYWWYKDLLYMENEDLGTAEVRALINTRDERRKRQIERAVATDAQGPITDGRAVRGSISGEIRNFVFQRDGGQCVRCASKVELQFDHIIPVVLGGSGEPENLPILCGPCNRRKGAGLS